MSSPDRQPSPRTGFRRLLSADGAVLAMLAAVSTAAVALAIGAVAGHFALATEVRQTHARIDETNARIDETNARIDETNARIDDVNNTLAARIDGTNARIDALTADMNAQFDRMFTLLQGTLQDHGRRLDAIERRLAETASPAGAGATP